MKRRAWLLYLLLGSTALAVYLLVPSWRVGPLFNLIALSSPVAIVLAVRLWKPERRSPWYLFALGQTLFVGGDVITYNYSRFFGTDLPFPSIGDLLYLAVYPCLVAGLLLLIHRRRPGRDRESLIDSMIVAIGIGTISWVFLMSPIAHDSDSTLIQKITGMAYPLMDLVLLTVVVRLAFSARRRLPSFHLMAGAAAALLVTDFVYSYISVQGIVYNQSGLLEAGWASFYLLWGAAALHPTMHTLDEIETHQELRHPRRRLVLLASASLMAPAVQLFLSLDRRAVDVPILAGCSAVLFVLVLVRLNGVMVDITEHRTTERALREAEAKYRSLVEGLPAVVYIAEFGKDGAWRYISPQIESILGFTRQEWMEEAQLWRERIVPEDRDRALAAELRLLNGEGRMRCEYRILGRDGRVIWIHEEAEALEDESGRPALLQGVMYDVTDQKKTEELLRATLDTEKEATKRLRDLHEMQNSFLQAVSHDLRTPLTSILGGALTLENDEGQISAEDAKDLIRRMASNARKLHRLLTNLLDLDRISRGIVEPNRDPVDLTPVIRAVVLECKTDTHSIEFTTQGPVHGNVDAAQVERIVENLVTNAVRYTPLGTCIWVHLTAQDDGVLLVVDDAGPGIPPELRETIFEPFRQGDEVINHSPGVGIGLSLVQKFAELHGGRAWVEQREGGGSSFRVFLPNKGGLRAASPARARSGESTPGRPHLLPAP